MSLLWCSLAMLVVPCGLTCVHLACSSIRFGVLVSKKNLASPGQNAAYLRANVNTCGQGAHVRQLCITRWSCWQKFGCKSAMYHPTLHSTLHFAQEHSLPWHRLRCTLCRLCHQADYNLHVLYSRSSIRYTWDEAPMLLQHNSAHKHIS